jgi:hypothetical protein
MRKPNEKKNDSLTAECLEQAAKTAEAFGLFVSSVPGRLVHRYATGEIIGGRRAPYQPSKLPGGTTNFLDRGAGIVSWDEKKIVALPHDELTRGAKRAYCRHIRDGSLKLRNKDEWIEQHAEALLAERRGARQATKAPKTETQPGS